MVDRTITAANAVLTLFQAILFPAPVQIQGFATDDVYDMDPIKSVETMMGVDGLLSGGFVYAEMVQNISLMADSESNDFFDTLWTQMQAAQDTYPLNGLIILPGIGSKFVMTRGFLTGYPPSPAAKKVLQPRKYQITWNRIAPAPL